MGCVTLKWLKKPGQVVAAAFAVAALGSFTSIPQDPSLAAAFTYEPQKWNDVSYEQLKQFYKEHKTAIERMIAVSYAKGPVDVQIVFRRKAQTQAEKAFTVVAMANDYMRKNPTYTVPEFADAMAHQYGTPRLEMMSILFDVKKIYTPHGYQQTNNCLAYSVNDRARSFDPKDYQGHPGSRTLGDAAWKVDNFKAKNYDAFVAQTIRGNIADGMIFTGDKMSSREGYYRVALYVRPIDKDVTDPMEAMDYHYVRQNRDGTWSHKFGALVVTNLDYSEKIIIHPQTADMGAYRFKGYFLVPRGGLDVGAATPKRTAVAGSPSALYPG